MRPIMFSAACLVIATLVAPVWAQTSESLGPATGTGDAGVITDPRSTGDAAGDLGPAQPQTQQSPNPAGTLGGVSPFESDGAAMNQPAAQQGAIENQPNVATVPGNARPLQAADIADWRMVQHNGRWWFWMPYERWLYYHNNNWVPYTPQQPLAERGQFQQRQRVGYRGDTRFDERANLGERAVQGSTTFRSQADFDRRAGAPGAIPGQRPILPTLDQLQQFQQQQLVPTDAMRPGAPGAQRFGPGQPGAAGGAGTTAPVGGAQQPGAAGGSNTSIDGNPLGPAPNPTADGTAPTGGTGSGAGAQATGTDGAAGSSATGTGDAGG